MDFRICLDLDSDQQLDPELYPMLCRRLQFRISRRGYRSWEYSFKIGLTGRYCSVLQTPILALLDLRDELFRASLQYDMFARILYDVSGRMCLHVLRSEEIRFISEAFGQIFLRCDFNHSVYSKKYGRKVEYITNNFLSEMARSEACHAFFLPAGAHYESIAERLLSKAGDSDALEWSAHDIPGTYLGEIVRVTSGEEDEWLGKLPAHAFSNTPAVPGGLTKENAAALLLLFQTDYEGYPWTLPKTLLDFLSANNLELCMLLVLETTYDGIQV